MRIIAGDYKGRKLEAPFDNDIRPTTDKVKEALFSILMPYTEDKVFVDLFSGTGGLGLEALSRGAMFCYFCDKDRNAIALIKKNIEKCGASDKSRIIHGDYMKLLHKLEGEKIDVIIMDPPYDSNLYEKALKEVELLDLLSYEGIIVAEHPKELKLPERIGRLSLNKQRVYGKTVLSIYETTEAMDVSEDVSREG